MKACGRKDLDKKKRFDPKENPELRNSIIAAKEAFIPDNYIHRTIQFAKQGFTEMQFPTYNVDWDSEAYMTVSGGENRVLGCGQGQNSSHFRPSARNQMPTTSKQGYLLGAKAILGAKSYIIRRSKANPGTNRTPI